MKNPVVHITYKVSMFSIVGLLINFIVMINLPVTIMSAEIDFDERNRHRQEDLDFLYTTLKEVHPDLFFNTSEVRFLAEKEEISRRIGGADDFTFSLELQRFAALAGDSHTTVSMDSRGLHLYPLDIAYYDGQWLLALAPKDKPDFLGRELIAINDFSLDLVYERFKEVISYDNEIKLRRQFTQLLSCSEMLEYFGFCGKGEELIITVLDVRGNESEISLGKPVEIEAMQAAAENLVFLDKLRKGIPPTEFDRGKIYFAQPLSDSVYYIQYNRCSEDDNLSMAEFCFHVTEDLRSAEYNKIIVDMRYNGGGGDGVLVPLLNLLSEIERGGNVKLFCLIDEMTFSSAINNTMMMKEMGAIIVGAPTSGSVNHFGSINRFMLPHSGINVVYSTKLIDIADYLECGHGYGIETLMPDYDAPQTLNDYLNGIDTAVQFVLDHGDDLKAPENNNAAITRGSFAGLLYQKAKEYGKGGERGSTAFADIFPFARNTPAVEWAYTAGIIGSINNERFASAHLISCEEISAVLDRFAEYLNFPLEEMPRTLLAGENGFESDKHINYKQGQELINSLFPIK